MKTNLDFGTPQGQEEVVEALQVKFIVNSW